MYICQKTENNMKKPKKIPLISNLTYLQKVLLLVLCGAVVGAGAYFCYLLRVHTYMGDGNPLPSFEGEPKKVDMTGLDIDDFTNMIWNALNEDNKVSLFVRYIDLETGKTDTRIVNKNTK